MQAKDGLILKRAKVNAQKPLARPDESRRTPSVIPSLLSEVFCHNRGSKGKSEEVRMKNHGGWRSGERRTPNIEHRTNGGTAAPRFPPPQLCRFSRPESDTPTPLYPESDCP